MVELIWLIPILPLIGFLINGLLGKHLGKQAVSVIGVSVVSVSFILALILLLQLPDGAEVRTYFDWIKVGTFSVGAALRLDQLSLVMVLVVTGVGSLIHLYSVGYMHQEKPLAYARYFAYINLFSFAMLVLVLANNFLLMFVGWEGVGLCSYLLIGFWYKKDSASDAGKKAFIVNRIGDAGFLLAIFMIFGIFGTLDYDVVLNPAIAAGAFQTHGMLIPLICLALFVGATGKSAQIPLYVWLPDAMEGPTPVSALIHAATMVTAGVYLVVRTNVLYALSPDILMVVAVIGALTALFSATIGLAQYDIKRVLAYSTVSQLGYMFFACGVGAYGAAIFHLMTHAFFKACLFLSSGSVIHGMHHEQDMRKMGGLKVMMPITYMTMLVSTLAIAGIPPFSGFFSKDAILWAAVAGGQNIIWLMGAAAALLTSFYMFRLMYMTFSGSFRSGEDLKKKVHESPATMTIPLVLLAALAVVAGFLSLPFAFHEAVEGLPTDQFGQFLAPDDVAVNSVIMADQVKIIAGSNPSHGEEAEETHVAPEENHSLAAQSKDIYLRLRDPQYQAVHGALTVDEALAEAGKVGGIIAMSRVIALEEKHAHEHDAGMEWLFMGISVALAGLGWVLARHFYKNREPDIVAEKTKPVFNVLHNKYWVDELYNFSVIRPLVSASRSILWKFFDAGLIDGVAVNGSAKTINMVGRVARLFQNGYVQHYLFFFLIGVLVLLAIIL